MAIEDGVKCITLPAAGDLSSSQYLFGAINASGQIAAAGDGAKADGVIYSDPDAANKATTVAIAGRVKVKAGATVTAGDDVASDASGQAVPVVSGDFLLGTAIEGGSSGDVISIIFQPTAIAQNNE